MTQQPTACLVFRTSSDEIACDGAGVGIELVGEGLNGSEAELVRQAAVGVIHYFREDLGRQSVTVGEFSLALAKVLRSFGLNIEDCARVEQRAAMAEADLTDLVAGAEGTFELGFFPRLRQELTRRLEPKPRMVRFTGLRRCVKKLAGARRWSSRCEALSDRIVDYVRQCLNEHQHAANCAVVLV
jgi:hypothetical protein